MEKVLTLRTNRAEYELSAVLDDSITVCELIELLKMYAPSMKVAFSNDNGFTYGYINAECLEIVEPKEEVEEEDDDR